MVHTSKSTSITEFGTAAILYATGPTEEFSPSTCSHTSAQAELSSNGSRAFSSMVGKSAKGSRRKNLPSISISTSPKGALRPFHTAAGPCRTASPQKTRAHSPTRERTYSDAYGQIRIRSPRGHLVVRSGSPTRSTPSPVSRRCASEMISPFNGAGSRIPSCSQTDTSSTKSNASVTPGTGSPVFAARTKGEGSFTRAHSLGDSDGYVHKMQSKIEVDEEHKPLEVRPMVTLDDEGLQAQLKQFETTQKPAPPGRLRRHRSMVEQDIKTSQLARTGLMNLGGSLKVSGGQSLLTAVHTSRSADKHAAAAASRRAQRRRTIVTKEPRSRSTERSVLARAEMLPAAGSFRGGHTWQHARDGINFKTLLQSSSSSTAAMFEIGALCKRASSASSSDDAALAMAMASAAAGSGGSWTGRRKVRRDVIFCVKLWGDDWVDKAMVLFCVLLLLITSAGILCLEAPARSRLSDPRALVCPWR